MSVYERRAADSVSPNILVDVALMTSIRPHSQLSPAEALHQTLPPLTDIVHSIERHASRSPNITTPILDPLIPYVPDDTENTTRTSDFDSKGRSRAARLAEAACLFLREDRHLVATEPSLLQVVLSARIFAQDALAVPGASRGFFADSASADVLSGVIREIEGALSYSLALFGEVQLTWHTSTIQRLEAGPPSDGADSLQRLLVTLRADIVQSGSDISARVFRDVLSRHLRQGGAGDKESEAWLAYGMSLSDKSQSKDSRCL